MLNRAPLTVIGLVHCLEVNEFISCILQVSLALCDLITGQAKGTREEDMFTKNAEQCLFY